MMKAVIHIAAASVLFVLSTDQDALSQEKIGDSVRPPLSDETSGSWVNVRTAYGAVGDGVADDTEALQAAFDSRGSIFIPSGRYRFTSTLETRPHLSVYGEGNEFGKEPAGRTVLLYDGPEGGIALLAENARPTRIRRLMIDGAGKAAIGMKCILFASYSLLEDVTITETREHALYVAWSWNANFVRLIAMGNYGNGVTLGSHPNRDPRSGEVNVLNFTSCKFQANGLDAERKYDGDKIVNTEYGLGIVGPCSSINIANSCFQSNQGAGLYIGTGRKVLVKLEGSYFESNSRALIATDQEINGKDFLGNPDRKPVGRKVSILIDSPWATRSSIVFDNTYIAGKRNGIWLKGSGSRELPIKFIRCYRPNVIYAEHGNWEWIDSTDVIVAGIAGVNFKSDGQSGFRPGSDVPGGHPGIRIQRGRRQLFPYDDGGLTLYVDTDGGDDRHDGRSPAKAWASIAKAATLLANTDLETPCTIDVRGRKATSLSLKSIRGTGVLTLRLADEVRLEQAEFVNLSCRVEVVSTGGAMLRDALADRCASIAFSSVTLEATDGEPGGVRAVNGANVEVLDCRVTGVEDADTGGAVTP